MIIYIAGKMTGLPDFGRKAFAEAEKKLTAEGHTALNPAWMPTNLPRECYMPICLSMINAAEAVYLLDGWEDSKGATIEKLYAEYHGKKVLMQRERTDEYDGEIRQ